MVFKNRLILFGIIFLAVTLPARAQLQMNLTTYLIRDDNAFKSREAYDEWMNNSTLRIGHRWGNASFQFQGYYNVDLLTYAENVDLNNSAHKFGSICTIHNDANTFSIRGFAHIHNFQESYIYYDVNRYNLNVEYQYNPDLANFLSLGMTINKDKYDEFIDLDNLTFRLYSRYQRFFPSKLSLTGEASLGMKNYVNQAEIQFYGSSPGMGRNPYGRYREDPVQTAQVALALNVGKSITSHLGMNVGIGGKWFIGDPIMAYTDGIYYYTENDLFDDPYSYQDLYVSVQFTRQFSIGFQAKLGFKYQTKDYAGTPALDEAGELIGETREDSRNEYFLLITKKFVTGWRFPSSIDVFANFMYRNNPSNDPYYDFEDHIGLLGFSINF